MKNRQPIVNVSCSKDIRCCSICGELFKGYGNNPDPVTTGENDRCCDICNAAQVIPARMKGMRAR